MQCNKYGRQRCQPLTPPVMQSIQLLALVTRSFEAAPPVLVRLVGSEVQFMPLEQESPSNADDESAWNVFQHCTAEDLPEMQEVVIALGGDPAVSLAAFPNCESY